MEDTVPKTRPTREDAINETMQLVESLVKQKKYSKAERHIHCHSKVFDHYIHLMSNNQGCKRAATTLASNGKKIEDYPELEIRLKKKSVRYLLRTYQWEFVELRLRNNLELLSLAAEDYFFKGKKSSYKANWQFSKDW